MSYGALSIVLHAHLPYVRHPEYPEFLEEDWLYEAITETYLPLLEVFDRCVDDAIPFRITMTLTPPLVGMLRDDPGGIRGRLIRSIRHWRSNVGRRAGFNGRSSAGFRTFRHWMWFGGTTAPRDIDRSQPARNASSLSRVTAATRGTAKSYGPVSDCALRRA